MKIDIGLIKKLREETGAPVIRVKRVLEEVMGDLPADATHQALQAGEKKAFAILQKEGFEKVAKRSARQTSEGKIFVYSHHTGKIVSVVELFCETDFVARNSLFEELGKNLAMQVAAMGEKDFEKQEFINPLGFQALLIKDPTKKVEDLVKGVIAKTGENIKIGRVLRIKLGE